MMRPLILVVSLVLSSVTQAQQTQLGSKLPLGKFRVGFEQDWLFDHGRSYQMKLPNGKMYGTAKTPRPILMNLWYPATVTGKQRPMPHGRYIEFTKGHPQIKEWLNAFSAYNREVICGEVTGQTEKKLDPSHQAAFKAFLDHPTNSVLGAKPINGKFPLVIYHAGFGSSIEDNTEACEYLASHGYVVVSSSYVRRQGDTFNIDAYTGSAGDINFLTSHLRRRPNVDWQHVGLVGHSGGAHFSLKYRAIFDGAVDAIVCLDTTEDYYSLLDPRWAFIKHDVLPNIRQMWGAIMMVANPYAFFDLADKFTAADRNYFTVALDHNEFISQGVQRLRVSLGQAELSTRAEVEKESRRVEENYRRLCEYLRGFFDAKLKGQPSLLTSLNNQYSGSPTSNGLPFAEVLPIGAETPTDFDLKKGGVPTPRQVRPLLAKIGVPRLVEIMSGGFSKTSRSPIFDPEFAYALEFDLFKQNRPEDAKILHSMYLSIGAKLAEEFINQAWFGDITKNYAFAEEVLTMLLFVEPNHEEGKKMLEDIPKKDEELRQVAKEILPGNPHCLTRRFCFCRGWLVFSRLGLCSLLIAC